MTNTEPHNLHEYTAETFWSEYERRVDDIADEVVHRLEEFERGVDSDDSSASFNGREWCEENDVPESVFAEAVQSRPQTLEWGVTPMRPWLIDGE